MAPECGGNEPGTVTGWYLAYQGGDAGAASRLFDLFFAQMVRQASYQLGHGRRGDAAVDGEDLALSALDSFFEAIRHRHDDRVRDRRSLWGLLHQILRRKVYDRLARRPPIATGSPAGFDHGDPLQPTPETIAELRDLLETCLAMLDEANRRIAVLHLDGYSLAEIAEVEERSKSMVGLRLQEIYKTWRRRFGEEAA